MSLTGKEIVEKYVLTCNDIPDLPSFPSLEEQMRDVKHDALEKENERNPLVVCFVGHFILVPVVSTHANLKVEEMDVHT